MTVGGANEQHVEPSAPVALVGLLWSDSRPSDDRETYNYNIPQNMLGDTPPPDASHSLHRTVCGRLPLAEGGWSLHCTSAAVVALNKLAKLAEITPPAGSADPGLAAKARALASSVDAAIQKFGVFKGNLTMPRMYGESCRCRLHRSRAVD